MSDLDLLDFLSADHLNFLEPGAVPPVAVIAQHLSVERDLLYPDIQHHAEGGERIVDGLRMSERYLEARIADFESEGTPEQRERLEAALQAHVDDQERLFVQLRTLIPEDVLIRSAGTLALGLGGSPTHGHRDLADGGPLGEVVEDVRSVFDHWRDRLHRR